MSNSGKRFRSTSTGIARIWREKPLFSIAMVLLLLVLFQTLQIGFNFESFGDWFAKWSRNWLNILLNNSYVGIIALGMTLVIISGGIDLAVGSTLVAVGAVVMVLLNERGGVFIGWGLTGPIANILAILVGLLLGLLLGSLNGLIIATWRVPPFIVTLGTMKIFRSVTQYYMQTNRGITLPDSFKNISKLPIFDSMLLPIIYWAVLAGLMHLLSRRTVFGRHVYAIGSNERTARLSGINIAWVKGKVYMLMGGIVAIAAIVQIARIGSMDYASAGSGYEMDAIAAVIIGGTSMSGGRGAIMGTVLGTLILAVMNNLLTLVGVDPFLREAFKGGIVVAAVLLQRRERSS